MDPTDQKKTACYDIDVEVDDPLKGQMNSFLSSTTNQQEIAALEMKVGPPVSHCHLHLTGIFRRVVIKGERVCYKSVIDSCTGFVYYRSMRRLSTLTS